MRPARCSDEVAPAGREAIILAEWAGRWHGWMGLLGVRADSLGVRRVAQRLLPRLRPPGRPHRAPGLVRPRGSLHGALPPVPPAPPSKLTQQPRSHPTPLTPRNCDALFRYPKYSVARVNVNVSRARVIATKQLRLSSSSQNDPVMPPHSEAGRRRKVRNGWSVQGRRIRKVGGHGRGCRVPRTPPPRRGSGTSRWRGRSRTTARRAHPRFNSAKHPPKLLVDLVHAEIIRIEVVTHPLPDVFVFFVIRVFQDSQLLVESPDPAAVLRRTLALSGDARGQAYLRGPAAGSSEA